MADAKRENGTIAANAQAVAISPNGRGCVAIELTGTWVINLDVKSLVDGTEENAKVYNAAGAVVSLPLTTNQIVYAYAAGREQIIVRANGYTSGSVAVVMNATDNVPFIASAGGGGGSASTDPAAPNAVELSDGTNYYQAATQTTAAAIKAKTDNLDVLLSTRTKPADQQHAIVDSSALPAGASTEATLALIKAKTDNIDVALSTRTKPADDQLTQGDVAHGGADSGNPNKMGFVAIAHGTNPTAVAAAQRTNAYANRAGVPFVIGGHPNVQTIAANFTAAQTDTAIITVATGTIIVVTGFLITCSNANSVNVSARLGFGAVNTPAYGAAQLIGTHPGIAAGSGFGRGGGSGIIGIGTDDQDLRLTCSVPTSGSLDVMVSYYTIAS